jgi:hypothetical protein
VSAVCRKAACLLNFEFMKRQWRPAALARAAAVTIAQPLGYSLKISLFKACHTLWEQPPEQLSAMTRRPAENIPAAGHADIKRCEQ